jgi:DNA-binding CsgD family transcriptional regulator
VRFSCSKHAFPCTIELARQARELEVLQRIADGKSNQAIAQELIVSLGTIKTHINNIYGKLNNVHNRTQPYASHSASQGVAPIVVESYPERHPWLLEPLFRLLVPLFGRKLQKQCDLHLVHCFQSYIEMSLGRLKV